MHAQTARPARQARPGRALTPAFTLIELLIVVGIISILIAAAILVGVRVTGSGKQRATEGVIKNLDMALGAMTHGERLPPAWVIDPRPGNDRTPRYIQPVADARNEAGGQNIINSVGLFLLQCSENPDAQAAIASIDPKFVRTYRPDYDPANPTGDVSDWSLQPELLTVFDGWDRPIRYVHPAFQGIYPKTGTAFVDVDTRAGQAPPGTQWGITSIRRTGKSQVGSGTPLDADAGMPATNRPYFYSMGADGKAGYEVQAGPPYSVVSDYNEDNIWVTMPRYEK